MALQIVDGKGTGFLAEVDNANRLKVAASSRSEMEVVSDSDGKSYSWASGTYNYTAADTILLVKNTSDDALHINKMWLSGDSDTRVVVHLPTTDVTVAGTTVTGVNLNTGSANTAEATAAQDETGNSQGDVVWSGEIFAAGPLIEVDFQGALILAKNKSVGVDYVSVGAACDVTIFGHFG